MARITYIEEDGTEKVFDVKIGYSVMEGGVKNGVRGIDADCGGACACATCHVYVRDDWFDRLPHVQPLEEAMLEFADGVGERSRLSCQIKVTEEIDGLVVNIPPRIG